MTTQWTGLGAQALGSQGQSGNNQTGYSQAAINPNASKPAPAAQVTAVFDKMKGFLKSTHWSKPYYSALVHNNPQLPYHLLEHVNCTYLSTPGRAPTLLALKQHAQSLAVLISLLAPAQFGGTFAPPNGGTANGDAPFAAEQAFDWLNDLQEHYHTDDIAHQKPLNALANLVKSNSDTQGTKWHCPLDVTGIELAEKHPFQQYRPYETHMTLLMHANEILERLDHEYSAMGGILGIIPLDSDNVSEQRALSQAKTTLVGQWILYTQHLVARMHELEIAYGNSLDLLANEAIVPMQHISVHGPDGRSGREIIFPQDRWIMANSGEDVFTFIHQMLDRAEAHQDARDDVYAEQKVLGDAAYSNNSELKYRGIVKVDLSTRFYRLRSSGHGPLFVLPAFGDRPNTKHTRDIENRPTVVTIPQPGPRGSVNAWESKHQDVDVKLLRLTVDKSNLEAKISQLNSSVEIRDREIARLLDIQKQYDDKIDTGDKDFAQQIVHLKENIRYFQKMIREAEEREKALKQDVENFKKANVNIQSDDGTFINPLIEKINDEQNQVRQLRKEIQDRDKKIEDLARDNDTLRILQSAPFNTSSVGTTEQVTQLQSQLASFQTERQMLQQEIHNLKKAKVVQGKILNLAENANLDYGNTFEDAQHGITACSTDYFKNLLAAEKERNDLQQKVDAGDQGAQSLQAQLNRCRAEGERLRKENEELKKSKGHAAQPPKTINLPWGLKHTSTFRDDNQGLIVLRTDWYDHLIAVEKTLHSSTEKIAGLQAQIKDLKSPAEANLSEIYNSAGEKLGAVKAYKDTKLNIGVMTLEYFEELEKRDQGQSDTQKKLDESLQNAQALQRQLTEARAQLQQLQNYLKSQSAVNSQVTDLQNKIADLQNKLNQCLEHRKSLEEQIKALSTELPEDDVKAKIAKLEKQLSLCSIERQTTANELTELRTRYNQLQLNETNLRAEVTSLRTRVGQLQNAAANTGAGSGNGDDELRAAKEELKLYKAELGKLQELWNDLQTQHLQLQSEFDYHKANSERECDEEKKALQQQIDDANESIKVLQMKLIAEPNKLTPAFIEIESQRNAARQHRDELQAKVRELEKQLALKK
ncbi:hypothetical protein NUW58_g2050 [Xylaria curta]|uniref:Uncharacterized protein n=1 Tax=Xylaria curta TaxID=42375 RepID=A0ACC1PJF2_9PEZI|nr:hypothetical protein NUW58_g2050 [Xylaria curta]